MGYTLHQDDQRVVLVTGTPGGTSHGHKTRNPKTGDQLQVWILAAGVSPLDAVQTGAESLICGDCKHTGPLGQRSCYVRVMDAPTAVWKAFQRGSYPFLARRFYADIFGGRAVRWGAYGDPCYVPRDVLYWGSFHAKRWTGYTHQWARYPELRHHLMASVDTDQEQRWASAAGWRTFRVRTESSALGANEISCPASDEAGKRTNCAACGLCNGVRYVPRDPRKDISILAHGSGKMNFLVQLGT